MGLFNNIKNFFFGKNTSIKDQTVTQEQNMISEYRYNEKQNSETLERLVKRQEIKPSTKIYIDRPKDNNDSEENLYIEDLWNYIDPSKNTQAHHIISVIGFDEWVDMEEIRRRIKSMFFIEYKNEKSLYPYIKTLTDIGLLENTSVGGKRKWKKREIVIKLIPKIEQTLKTKI